jgi:hypothetical protein
MALPPALCTPTALLVALWLVKLRWRWRTQAFAAAWSWSRRSWSPVK